jgi:hypothetical protein
MVSRCQSVVAAQRSAQTRNCEFRRTVPPVVEIRAPCYTLLLVLSTPPQFTGWNGWDGWRRTCCPRHTDTLGPSTFLSRSRSAVHHVAVTPVSHLPGPRSGRQSTGQPSAAHMMWVPCGRSVQAASTHHPLTLTLTSPSRHVNPAHLGRCGPSAAAEHTSSSAATHSLPVSQFVNQSMRVTALDCTTPRSLSPSARSRPMPDGGRHGRSPFDQAPGR